jgi:hypothetical protein
MALTQNDYKMIANAIGIINRAAEGHIAEQNTAEEQAFFQGILRGCELITNQLRFDFICTSNGKFDVEKFMAVAGFETEKAGA